VKHILAAAASIFLIAADAPPAPDWMAGAWEEKSGDDWNDEFWTTMRGGVMMGAARVGKGDRFTMWESTRIERDADGGLIFWASPKGAPPSPFAMVKASETMIEFANPAHDYPQRIKYWRDGAMLKAEVSLIDGSNAMKWSYRAMGAR
jgi:Domain of unknown function (DUF6265)